MRILKNDELNDLSIWQALRLLNIRAELGSRLSLNNLICFYLIKFFFLVLQDISQSELIMLESFLLFICEAMINMLLKGL